MNTDNMDTLPDLARTIHAQSAPARPAILAPGREPLGYDVLWSHTAGLARFLAGCGLRRGDAVALVLPDGPEHLVSFLAVSRVAACAPLNPAFRPTEFEFSLSDLRARAVIVQAGLDSAAAAVARQLGIQVIEAVPDRSAPAGCLSFHWGGQVPVPSDPPVYDAATALLLHTSATTGRAKLVPLSHAQIGAMVDVIRRGFPRADGGRVLMITPQFHLHCLLSILVQLFSGGACIFTPGFDPDSFLDWMRSFAPTQYTANPTLHRAILSLCPPSETHALFRSLRFVTSTGAPMPPELQTELEACLGVPVVDGYGLTEAGRVTVTPFEPARRKPGSVGLCIGPEVAIVGPGDVHLGPGEQGEIVLRGPMVTSGYAHQPEVNREAFRNGWFHTGDLGYRDAEGFLYVTGRLKEMINRGGEKVLPYEVEAVLSRHPHVREVAVFGFPHPRLGEDVAAAVVLRPGMTINPHELRRFALADLAEFKVPRRVLVVDEIPKGSTGKPRRAKLAELLGIVAEPAAAPSPLSEAPPRDPFQAQLAAIWAELLKVPAIGDTDDFFAAGGDSLLALTMLLRVQEACGCQLGSGLLAHASHFSRFAEAVRVAVESASLPAATISRAKAAPDHALFLINGGLLYRHLVQRFGDRWPISALELPDQFGCPKISSIGVIAGEYVAVLRRVKPHGPYLLGGYSLDGLLAYEIACQLAEQGELISAVVLLDSECYGYNLKPWMPRLALQTVYLACRAAGVAWRLSRVPISSWRRYVQEHRQWLESRSAYELAMEKAFRCFTLRPLSAPVLLLCCRDEAPSRRLWMKHAWTRLVGSRIAIREIPGSHATLIRDPYVTPVAEEVLDYLRRHAASDLTDPHCRGGDGDH